MASEERFRTDTGQVGKPEVESPDWPHGYPGFILTATILLIGMHIRMTSPGFNIWSPRDPGISCNVDASTSTGMQMGTQLSCAW